MKAHDIERCTCELVRFQNAAGERVEEVQSLTPDCRVHGLPDGKEWPAGHPLQRHAKVIDRKTGRAVTREEARRILRVRKNEAVNWYAWNARFRDEWPRETEKRLLCEKAAGQDA